MITQDLSQYVGQYVALADVSDNADVVAYGDRIHHVYESAVESGYDSPVVTFVPPSDMICSY